jgi:hypothetical protein
MAISILHSQNFIFQITIYLADNGGTTGFFVAISDLAMAQL